MILTKNFFFPSIDIPYDQQLFEILDVPMSKSRRSDALDAWKYFWLHTPVSIYIWKFLLKLGQTGGNSVVCPFYVIENAITKVRFNDEYFMF
jgi:hypothetical protein